MLETAAQSAASAVEAWLDASQAVEKAVPRLGCGSKGVGTYGGKAKVGFGSVAGGIPRYRVCRHFLATLQLANNGNLDLEHAHGADALAPADAFKLALLTTVNAHDSLHEGDFENH